MFGYIIVNKQELKFREFDVYQSYYCGLCQSLKERFGRRGQLTLSYDMTFVALLLSALYDEPVESSTCKCVAHPFEAHATSRSVFTDYAADMNVILSYQNFEDDWKDDRSYAKRTFMKMFEKDYERIRGVYPRQVQAVEDYMKKQADAETRKETNLDVVAGLTGELLGEIFAWKEDMWAEELKCLGFYMGKFIYIMDAYEDRKSDEKKAAFNPLIAMEQENEADFETLCKLILTSMMSECAKSFERLPVLLHADILRNVLYSGVWSRYEYIQKRKQKGRGSSDGKPKSV